jgi:hypothetical protein
MMDEFSILEGAGDCGGEHQREGFALGRHGFPSEAAGRSSKQRFEARAAFAAAGFSLLKKLKL